LNGVHLTLSIFDNSLNHPSLVVLMATKKQLTLTRRFNYILMATKKQLILTSCFNDIKDNDYKD